MTLDKKNEVLVFGNTDTIGELNRQKRIDENGFIEVTGIKLGATGEIKDTEYGVELRNFSIMSQVSYDGNNITDIRGDDEEYSMFDFDIIFDGMFYDKEKKCHCVYSENIIERLGFRK